MSKRFLLARAMERSGLTRFVEALPVKPGIFILTHHRIGDTSRTQFDRGVFSATCDEFDQQVRFLKRRFPIVGGAELEELVYSRKPLRHLHVAITFDDGYRDNYTNAFGILRSHGVPGHFFLVPTFVGTATIPWWDAIAYCVRRTARPELSLSLPTPTTVSTENREEAIRSVLRHYKRSDNRDRDAFMRDLQQQAEVDLPHSETRFLNWKEASEMLAAGMTIGSHTLTHPILSHLSEPEQEHELRASRDLLEQHLGSRITSLAYPIGSTTAFNDATERIAEQAGYTVSLSFYGGLNRPGTIRPTNVLRTSMDSERLMFRNQVAFLSHIGRIPY